MKLVIGPIIPASLQLVTGAVSFVLGKAHS